MANLGEQIQLYNAATGSAVDPAMYITLSLNNYSQSGDYVTFSFHAVLSIPSAEPNVSWYNNKININTQIPSSTRGEEWDIYEIKPTTTKPTISSSYPYDYSWTVPISAGRFPINIKLEDAQNNTWATGNYTYFCDMPITKTVPVISDLSFSNITSNSATASFSVTDAGNGTINGYQFDVTTDSSFQTGVDHHNPSSSSINLTLLTRYTTYWVRSKASNEVGWSSWNTAQSFTTLPTAPVVSKLSISKITFGSITASFSVSDTGGPDLTTTVIQASKSSTFASGVKTINGTSGTFNGLDPNTKYYLRAYATNASNLTSITSTITKNTKEYNPPTTGTIKISLEVVAGTGGPNETGYLVEPVTTSTFIGSWTEPSWGSADDATTEVIIKKGFYIQWVKMTKINGGYVDSNYGEMITIDANSLASKRESSKTLNRTDFKPGDKIGLKVQPFSIYNGKIYIPMSKNIGLWASSNFIELLVKRFVQIVKPGETDFKYERIYISKNGGNFTELEKDQTFKTI